MSVIDELEAATTRYRETEAAHDESRTRVVAAVLDALRAGERPTDVAAKSPFTETYVRRLAREHGIPEYLLRRYPRARGELEAALPDWRSIADAIAASGLDLDDSEFVGGELWRGLTRQGDPDQQKQAIADRLTRWATRNGGNPDEVARALYRILGEYL